jgi:hypothetical protein
MNFRRVAIACVAPLTLQLATLSAPALAQRSTPTSFERAMLAQLDAPTRAEVTRRATGGNTVLNVVGTILLNNYQAAGPRNPGEALTVVAVDFARGVAVLRRAENAFEIVRFDPRTLRLL